MKPSCHFRFIQRKVGDSIADFRTILQQWWMAVSLSGETVPWEGEWRDVPFEWDERNQAAPA
jgi:hypothetical protein